MIKREKRLASYRRRTGHALREGFAGGQNSRITAEKATNRMGNDPETRNSFGSGFVHIGTDQCGTLTPTKKQSTIEPSVRVSKVQKMWSRGDFSRDRSILLIVGCWVRKVKFLFSRSRSSGRKTSSRVRSTHHSSNQLKPTQCKTDKVLFITNNSWYLPQWMLYNWHEQFYAHRTRHHRDPWSSHRTLLVKCAINRTLNRGKRREMEVMIVSLTHITGCHDVIAKVTAKFIAGEHLSRFACRCRWFDSWNSMTNDHVGVKPHCTTENNLNSAYWTWISSEENRALYFLFGRSNHRWQPTRLARIRQ